MTRILGSWKILCFEHGTVEQHIFDLEQAKEKAIKHRENCGARLFVVEEWQNDQIKKMREENINRYEDRRTINHLNHRRFEHYGANQE